MPTAAMDKQTRYQTIARVTYIGSAIDLALGVGKIIGGTITGSQALLADGIHSLSDLVTDFAVIFAAKHASLEADDDHPYGHGRFETLATVALALAMFLVAIGIGYDAWQTLQNETFLAVPGIAALYIALISVVAKEGIYQYTVRVGKKINSDLLIANAWHSRSDALSSIAVVIGVGGAQFGFTSLDAIAAIFVALSIAWAAYALGSKGIRELVDTGLSSEEIAVIENLIRETEGVVSVHMLRSRSLGTAIMLDVHIQVMGRLSVSEGHQISEHVALRLKTQANQPLDITVHIDPEDDETAKVSLNLPPRSQVLKDLMQIWPQVPEDCLREMTLHYLNGKLSIDLTLTIDQQSGLASREQTQAMVASFQELPYAGQLKVSYACTK